MLKHHLQTWQHKQGKFAELQVIQLKMMLSTLNIDSITKSDILILEAYFKTIHSWTFFELYLFGHAMPFLEEKFMFHLFQELHQKGILYDNFRYDSFSMLFYIYNNIILFMLDHNHFDTADLLIQKLTYYFNQQEKKELGLRLIRKANLISYLSEHDLKFINNEKRYLSKYLTNADLQMVFDFSEII